MVRPIAFYNGEFLPASELTLQPQDTGFMLGVTVAEQLRTFAGKIFRWREHLARLKQSLNILGVDGVDFQAVTSAAHEVARHNFCLVEPSGDLGVTIFVTPGLYPMYGDRGHPGPNIGIHTYPLPFSLWAEKYDTGQKCIVTSVPQVSSACWPRELKCRSRAHYYLADQEARAADPSARAILLDDNGEVNEASTANVVAYIADEGLVSPPLESILPGVSLAFLEQIAVEAGMNFTYRRLQVQELKSADEILLTSTPFCLLPVSQLDERVLPNRETHARLLDVWSHRVGIVIKAQAQQSKLATN